MALWHGAGDRVRSVFCTMRELASGSGCCQPCASVASMASFSRMADSAMQRMQQYEQVPSSDAQGILGVATGVRHTNMSAAELRMKCDALALRADGARRQHKRHQAQVSAAQSRVLTLKQGAAEACESQPKFLQLLHKAHDEGRLQDRQALIALMEGVGSALVLGRRHRRLNSVQQATFTTLLNFGGPLVH